MKDALSFANFNNDEATNRLDSLDAAIITYSCITN